MIKTLRITIILTAIVAGLFFVLSGVFGLRHDKEKEAFLANPTITEVFKKGAAKKGNEEPDLPLVAQAQALALRINPPPPKVEAHVQPEKIIETPKFRLLGTSYYPDDPNQSRALVDEPGKGMHWVSVSDKIGHLTITGIGNQKIGYTDGQKNMEMLAEKPEQVSQIIVISTNESAKSPVVAALETPAAQIEAPETVDVPPTAEQLKDNVEFVKKLMADPNSLGVNAAEANDLKDLGEFLQRLEKEQAQAQAEANQPKEEPNLTGSEPGVRHSE
jgi:hypothetical protein